MKNPSKLEYTDYLQLEKLLSCQKTQSEISGKAVHDENLFITVHHSYEIWFKQLILELDSVISIFSQKTVAESEMSVVTSRIGRMVEIMKALVAQVDILETMTPLDFLEFRDLLYPASGFQSFQFRLFENRLGLKAESRLSYNDLPYYTQLSPARAADVRAAEKAPTLFECLEKWLERTPFLHTEEFNFWAEYKKAVETAFGYEEQMLNVNQFLNEEEKAFQRANMKRNRDGFEALFNESEFNAQRTAGDWRLSHKAVLAALLIQLYRDEPGFQVPFRLLTAILDLDATLTQWRYRHALMAQRMLGRRVGTGGSSGGDYLKKTAEHHRVFTDFYRLTTFLIPRSKLPELPSTVKKKLGFNYQ